MANPIRVEIKVSGKPLAQVRADFSRAVVQSLEDIGENFVKRSRLITAIDTETLRKSIRYDLIRSSVRPKVVVSADTHYALKVHEQHVPAANASFGQGARTKAQPVQREGIAGGAYFSRTVDFNAKLWRDHSAKLLDAALRGRNSRAKLP